MRIQKSVSAKSGTRVVRGAFAARRQPPDRAEARKVGGASSSALSGICSVVMQIVAANAVALRILFDGQPKATVIRIAVGVAGVAAPVLGWWGNGLMVDSLTRTHSPGQVLLGAAAFVASLAILGVIPVAISSLERLSNNWVFETVFGKFTRKMITFNQEHLSDPALAEQVKQVRERAVWRMMDLARGQPQLIRTLGSLLVAGVLLAIKAPILLIVLVGFSLPSMIIELRHAYRRCQLDERLAPAWGALWGDLYNLMVTPALAMLHQFGAAMWFAARYRRGLATLSREEARLETAAAVKRVLAALLVGLGLGLIVWALARDTVNGVLTVGEFVLILGAASSFAGCLAESASLLGQQRSQAKSVQDLLDLLKHPKSAPVSHRTIPFEEEYGAGLRTEESSSGDSRGEAAELEFRDVWYRYPSAAPGQYAVKGISFSVKRGSVVAVVGPNGAGKSSTMALLLRQLEATRGSILIDGKPIDQMTAEEFANEVVMLPQQMRHFNLNLRELLNLGRAKEPAPDDVLWRELERIGASEFVRKWKAGLDTPLGLDRREAVEPSGGQLQRLLLAAVVVANRGLIVMDEPVSAVDPEAAKQFWDALFSETTDRTVIFSTHHLGAVRRADAILFVEDGQIAAQGTHDELMATSERYRKLFEAQANEYR